MNRFLGTILFCLILGTTFIPMASAKQPDNKSVSKTPGAFAMMTLQQLGRLNHASRVQYLQLLRETVIEYEKFQNLFQMEMAANAFRDKPELYALIMGENANAADKFYRNLNKSVTDEGCIYGGHYQHYMTGQGAYGCIRPQCTKKIQSEWKSTYAKGKQFGDSYVQCSFTTFGIEWCVTPGINSTEACEKKSGEMESQREAEVTKWLAENVTDKWKGLRPDERVKLVAELKERSFDPRVMSHLVKLAADYQKEHKNFDAIPELADFEGFDVKTQGMNSLFRSFKEHCTKEMDADTAVKSVESEKGPLAKRRQAYLKEVRAKGHPVRVGNVLQRKECEILIGKYNMDDDTFAGGRYKRLMDMYETISRQGYPDGIPDRPKTVVTEDDARQKLQPVEEVVVVDEPPPDPNKIVKSVATGCRPTHRLLIDRGMQCAKCVAEKSIAEGESGSYIKGPPISEKWLALLTTMMHYCEREWTGGSIDPRDLAKKALEYSQTFGHCSEGEYKWDSLSWEQQRLVQSWQLGREFGQTDSPGFFASLKGERDKFKDVYGVSISQASRLFCSRPSDYNTGKSFGERFHGDPWRALAQRRETMFQNHASMMEDHPSGEGDPKPSKYAATGVAKCIERIEKRRGEGTLFSTSKGAWRCQGLVSIARNNMQRASNWAMAEQPVVAIDSNGHCYVSDTTHSYGSGKVSMVFANPKNGGSPRPIYTAEKGALGKWQTPNGVGISLVSVGGDSGKSYCPDDQGRKGNYIPPTKDWKRPSSGEVDRGSR